MYCTSCGHSTAGEGRCRRCRAPVALPGEGELRGAWQGAGEIAWGTPTLPFQISTEVPLDRRRISRDPPPAGIPEPSPGAPDPADAIVRAPRRSDRAIRWLEKARRTDDLLSRMGETLLANPLDPRPVPALERRAAATGNEVLLAELYEALLDARPDHPSRPTLMRRIERLRPPAAAFGASPSEAEGGDAPLPEVATAPPTLEAQPAPTARFALPATPPGVDLPWNPDSEDERVEAAAPGGLAFDGGTPASPIGGRGLDSSEDRAPVLGADREGLCRVGPHLAEEIDVELGQPIAGRRDEAGPAPSRTGFVLRRVGAWVIDGALLAGTSGTILLLATGSVRDALALVTGHRLGAGQGFSLAGLALVGAIAFVYLTLCWTLGGRTLGGSLAGVRAVDRESGAPLAIGRAALRALFAIAGTLAFLAGPLWALVDRDGEALHDKLARSVIVPG